MRTSKTQSSQFGETVGGVMGQSVSPHHYQPAWQRTELRWVYGDTGMMKTDWAAGVYGDTGVAEMDALMGGINSGDPGVHILHGTSYHRIPSYNGLYTLAFPFFYPSCCLRDSVWIHAIEWILTAG